MFYLLVWLVPFRIIAAYVSSAHTVPTGNAHFSLWTMVIAGVSNVILDLLFIPKFGFIGVVYSTLICYTFAIVSFVVLYYFKLNKLTKNDVKTIKISKKILKNNKRKNNKD
jgi:Na+-driven multidrug efflux pump